jgi:hypothetical protein
MENTIEKFKPKRGDRVLVWDDNEKNPIERIFLCEIEGVSKPYICVSTNTEKDFINGNTFVATFWTNIKPIPRKEIPKDTLVWVKMVEDDEWLLKFYSHFEGGKHYCFISQKKSHQEKKTHEWKFLTDKNPFE